MKVDIESLNRYLRSRAVSYGMCADWQRRWDRVLSYDELLAMFVESFDFSVLHDWLDYRVCKTAFPSAALHARNIYIDERVELSCSHGYYIFLGCCDATLSVDGFQAVTVYVRHSSRVVVHATGGARVFITEYDGGESSFTADSISKVSSHRYLLTK